MYEKLIETEDKDMNQIKVDSIGEILNELEKVYHYVLKDNTFKIEENKKIIDIVKKILDFIQSNQKGKGLKILTPDQILSRLPIISAKLNAGNDSEKLKNEIRQILYSFCRSKKLTKKSIKA